MEKVLLFCIPYAGGLAGTYLKWKKYLDSSIELFPVELAGRGQRNEFPLYNTLDDAVVDIHYVVLNHNGPSSTGCGCSAWKLDHRVACGSLAQNLGH